MRSPETRHMPEGDKQNPYKEGSPLKSSERVEEQKLNPEQAMEDEENRLGGVLTSIAEKMKQMPKKARLTMAVFMGASLLAMGEGAMREAHGQAREKSGPAVESAFDKYARDAQEIHNKKYTDELTLRALHMLYTIPDRKQAKYLIEDFARHTNQDVGLAAEMLSADIPRLIDELYGRKIEFRDGDTFEEFMRIMREEHPGIEEVIEGARIWNEKETDDIDQYKIRDPKDPRRDKITP